MRPTAGWQAAPGAAVLREQIPGSEICKSPVGAVSGNTQGPGLTQHFSWPRAGERGLEVRGHGHRPPLPMDLRLRLCLWHRWHVPAAPLPELHHQLPAAARPGHPHLQIAWGMASPRAREMMGTGLRQPLQTNKYSHRTGLVPSGVISSYTVLCRPERAGCSQGWGDSGCL